MTVQDILEEVYESAGNEKKLCPGTYPYTPGSSTFDIAAAGSVRMLRWLNIGYKFISKMKLPDGTPVRFPSVEAEMYFKTTVIEGNVTAATATTATIDATGDADVYNGWLISIEDGTGEGQVRMVVDWDGSDVTVHQDWDTTPDATSDFMLYKRFLRLANPSDSDQAYHILVPSANSVVNILKITDIGDGRELAYGGHSQSYPAEIVEGGRPRGYVRYGKGIFFNSAPRETYWYRMEYEKELASLTAGNDEPDLPEQWQHLLFLWMVWKARHWAFEPNAAYGAKRDFVDFLKMTQLPDEMEFERAEGQVSPDMN